MDLYDGDWLRMWNSNLYVSYLCEVKIEDLH